ncbi:hypothetical protein LG324_05300 [Phycicoccus jejuensis]|jgi:hypothetical protein|uniref:hypothetical protein n=1 Tax=Phycicoccus jejuensis TaxID=367299 RepID=UPI00384CC053
MTVLVDYVRALTPPVAIGFVFYRIIRSMLEADRRERRALARWEAEQGADAAPEPPSGADGTADDVK